ncbi:DUF3429 domain-containing protein [uncultured Alcanivorax sp.]|uniref:DUF3429 domain-containing protein n=1 Tax=uncultured Alcanivorax sp. TaxID=191215 RepID=UPI00258548AC|nr:DUF3429 domain-containing protein [uncultured Alcanivorax sp.]
MRTRQEKNIRRAKALSYSGLIPFYGMAGLSWFAQTGSWALHALATYSAIVLAFLGAIHWGRALDKMPYSNQYPTLLFGLIPALLAWLSLLLPLELSLPMLAAGLMFVWGTEQMVFNDTLPTWYRHLRHQLTAAAVIAVLFGWAATMFWML